MPHGMSSEEKVHEAMLAEVERELCGAKSVRITVTITERQRDGLRRISEKTGVPISQYVREALGRVLDLAEKQAKTIEAACRSPVSR